MLGGRLPACLAWLLLAHRAAAATCAPEPLAIEIGNVTLSNNQVARGLELSVGTPPQPFAFLPQWPLNNTFVYGTSGRCAADYSAAKCTTFRGGAYDAIASSSRTVPAADAYPADAAPWSSVSHAADTLVLGVSGSRNGSAVSTGPALDRFPLGVPLNDLGQQGYHPMNAVGMGFNSTLLTRLRDAGAIASRTWSMFWGLNGADATSQMAGLFVLGGYDAAKTVPDQKVTLPLADAGSPAAAACPSRMVLSITDLVLNFANGTDASLFPGAASAALQACLVPDYPVLLTLPDDPYFQAFETLTNQSLDGNDSRALGLVFFANRYPPPAPGVTVYAGDLTIRFASGLAIRVPNDQLIVPDRYIDDATGAVRTNASSGPDTTLLAIQDVNANDMAQLGRQFLSAAYVMCNQDAASFTLWPANPTTRRQLVAVDPANADLPACASTAANSTAANSTAAASTAAASSPTTAVHSSKTSLSAGALAGAVAGGCAALAAAVGAAVFVWRRRQRQRPQLPSYTADLAWKDDAASRTFASSDDDGKTREMDGTPAPAELMAAAPTRRPFSYRHAAAVPQHYELQG